LTGQLAADLKALRAGRLNGRLNGLEKTALQVKRALAVVALFLVELSHEHDLDLLPGRAVVPRKRRALVKVALLLKLGLAGNRARSPWRPASRTWRT